MRKFAPLFFAVIIVALGVLLNACSISQTGNAHGATPASATKIAADGAEQLSTPQPTHNASNTRTATRRATASSNAETENGFQKITRAELPPEAIKTLALIHSDGPFPYRQDGQVFQNREGYLPKKSQGYYHEYTVVTPGASNRSTRRIITGSSGEFYYTDDHYNSFKIILDP